MSLSKLGSSGTSSKDSFDGQNPFSEKQHPLLLPTVLDTIFPYLTFSEVKSSRLVCKAWAEVGIPFIGRKKLEPVKFSSITFEDFVTLKKEFLKFPQKIKFFQGFELKWHEMSGMIYCNFLKSFKPNQLVISGRNISTDPSTNLMSLLQPVLTTLNHLSLDIDLDSSYSRRSFTDLLKNFAQLQPMTLKTLCLKIFVDEDHQLTHIQLNDMYRAFEVVFQSQSPTFEELELEFLCVVSKTGKYRSDKIIEFPVFPFLQQLTLALDILETPITRDDYNYLTILPPFDFCDKFPQLVQLDILDTTLYKMKEDAFVLTRGHPLMKKLKVSEYNFDSSLDVDDNIEIFENLYLSFPYIEELRIEDTRLLNLQLGGIEIPWVDTLRVLKCFGSHEDFNFGHLKRLEHLHYTIYADIDFEAEEFQITSFIEMLLEHHRQLPHLKRFHLTYACGHIIPPEKMSQILEALPEEFRAILTFSY